MFKKSSDEVIHQNEVVSSSHDDVETVVGPSVHVEGDFASEGNILVKGMVSGNVKTSKLLTAEPGSKILANVRAGSAVVAGSIVGNVKVLDRLEVTSSAQIAGDVECKILVVEAGAKIHGKITMKGLEIDMPKAEKKSSLIRRIDKSSDTEMES